MSELKAMGLVAVGMSLLFIVFSAGVMIAEAPGELLAVALGLAGAIGGFAMARVIKHYEATGERRKREEILLR